MTAALGRPGSLSLLIWHLASASASLAGDILFLVLKIGYNTFVWLWTNLCDIWRLLVCSIISTVISIGGAVLNFLWVNMSVWVLAGAAYAFWLHAASLHRRIPNQS